MENGLRIRFFSSFLFDGLLQMGFRMLVNENTILDGSVLLDDSLSNA